MKAEDYDYLSNNSRKRIKIKKNKRKISPQIKNDLTKDLDITNYKTNPDNLRKFKKKVLDHNKLNELFGNPIHKRISTDPIPNSIKEEPDTDERIYFYEPKAKSDINLNNSESFYYFPEEKLSPQKAINLNLLMDDYKYEEMLNKCRKYDLLVKKYKKLYKELNDLKMKHSTYSISNNFYDSDYSISSIDLKCFATNNVTEQPTQPTYHNKRYLIFCDEKFNDDTKTNSIYEPEINTKPTKKKKKGKKLVKKELKKPEDGETKVTNIRNTIKRKIIISQITKIDVPSVDRKDIKEKPKNQKSNSKTKYLRFTSTNKRNPKSNEPNKNDNKSVDNFQNNINLYKKYQLDRCSSESLSIIHQKKKGVPKKKKDKLKVEKIPNVNIKVKYCPKFTKCVYTNEISNFNIIDDNKKVFNEESLCANKEKSLEIITDKDELLKEKLNKINNENQQKKENEFEITNNNIKKSPKQKSKDDIKKNSFDDLKIENNNMSIIDDVNLTDNKKTTKNMCKIFNQDEFSIDTYNLSIKRRKKTANKNKNKVFNQGDLAINNSSFSIKKRKKVQNKNKCKGFNQDDFGIDTYSLSIKKRKKVTTTKKKIIEENTAPHKKKECCKKLFKDDEDDNIINYPSNNAKKNNKGNFETKSTPTENLNENNKNKNNNSGKSENDSEETADIIQSGDGKNIIKCKKKQTNLNEEETIPNNNQQNNITNNRPQIDLNKIKSTKTPEDSQNLNDKIPTETTHTERDNDDENENNEEDDDSNLGKVEDSKKVKKTRRKTKIIYVTKEDIFYPKFKDSSLQLEPNVAFVEINPRKKMKSYKEKLEDYLNRNNRKNNLSVSRNKSDNDKEEADNSIPNLKNMTFTNGFRKKYNLNSFNSDKSLKNNLIESCIQIQLIQDKTKKPIVIDNDVNNIYIPKTENKKTTKNQPKLKHNNKKNKKDNKLLPLVKPLNNLCEKIKKLNDEKNFDDFIDKLKPKALVSHLDDLDNKNKNKLLKDALDKLKLNKIIDELKKYRNNELNIDNSIKIEIIPSIDPEDKYRDFDDHLEKIDNKYKNKLKKHAFDKCIINNEIIKLIDELKMYGDSELEIEYNANINIIQEVVPLNKNKQFNLNELSVDNQIIYNLEPEYENLKLRNLNKKNEDIILCSIPQNSFCIDSNLNKNYDFDSSKNKNIINNKEPINISSFYIPPANQKKIIQLYPEEQNTLYIKKCKNKKNKNSISLGSLKGNETPNPDDTKDFVKNKIYKTLLPLYLKTLLPKKCKIENWPSFKNLLIVNSFVSHLSNIDNDIINQSKKKLLRELYKGKPKQNYSLCPNEKFSIYKNNSNFIYIQEDSYNDDKLEDISEKEELNENSKLVEGIKKLDKVINRMFYGESNDEVNMKFKNLIKKKCKLITTK